VSCTEKVEQESDKEGREGDGGCCCFECQVANTFVVEHDKAVEQQVDEGSGDDDAL
jgi:hypothetical protein